VAGLLAAACATPVRDLPREGGLPADAAIVAGSFHLHGTSVPPRLLLRGSDGREVSLRPELDPFVVALPAGTYEVVSFGGHYPKYDRPRLVAVKGEARYVGSFHAARDRDGDLTIVVRDSRAADSPWIHETYPTLPVPLPISLVSSALEPAPGTTELAIAVERPEPPRHHAHFGFGFRTFRRCR